MKNFMIIALSTMFITGIASAQDKFKFSGSKSCMPCHLAAKTGAAYKIWQESKHAKAFATLASAEALEVAKTKSITDPQKSEACLKCHVTAHGATAAMLAPTFKGAEEGVGCESCHGPGSEYKAMATMKGIAAGTIKKESVGLIEPNEKTCMKCHNAESPTFKGFKFAEYAAKIAHPAPKQ